MIIILIANGLHYAIGQKIVVSVGQSRDRKWRSGPLDDVIDFLHILTQLCD